MVSIAGKTGTAQVVAMKPDGDKDKNKELPKEYRDHAWFVAFAPLEHPRIAVAVLVEHMGHGGSAAAPLAKALIEAYMRFQATPQESSL
jgi:penicillin-binding protein 2